MLLPCIRVLQLFVALHSRRFPICPSLKRNLVRPLVHCFSESAYFVRLHHQKVVDIDWAAYRSKLNPAVVDLFDNAYKSMSLLPSFRKLCLLTLPVPYLSSLPLDVAIRGYT